jgi:Tfp pilus assembly protein PilF
VAEKLPLLLLSAGAATLTVVAQSAGGAMRSFEQLSLGTRLENALASYGTYFIKHLWPADLMFFQVMRSPSVAFLIFSIALIAGVSAAAYRLRGRIPAVIVGWLWFLGALFPVIGIIQVGDQAWASRYSYFPSIGLFIAVAWLLPVPVTAAGSQNRSAWPVIVAAGVVVCGFTWRSFVEAGYWRQSEMLYQRSIALDPGNFVGHAKLASLYVELGAQDLAVHHANLGLRLAESAGQRSVAGDILLTLSRAYMDGGRFEQAQAALDRAEQIAPDAPMLHYNRGTLAILRGVPSDSLPHFERAIQLNPRYSEAFNNRGVALSRLGRSDEAIDAHRQAIRLDPFNYQANFNAGVTLAATGRMTEALAAFESAAKLAPQDVRSRLRAAAILRSLGRKGEAQAYYQAVLRIDPANMVARSEASR